MRDILYVITGTSRGIGHELEKILIKEGVDFIAINRENVDFRDSSSVAALGARLTDTVKQKYPHHEIVFINNAGYLEPPAPLWETSAATIVSSVSINLIAPLLLFSAFSKTGNPWRVVNLTSGAARTVNKYLGLYSTTKLAIEKYSQFLELEGDESNCLGVCNYNPGIVKTHMNQILKESKYFKNEKFENSVPRNPTSVAMHLWTHLQELNKDDESSD